DLLAESADAGPDLRSPCWQQTLPSDPRRAFEIGAVLLSRFEIIGFLGAGGLGEVYRAFDHQQQNFVALKTPKPALAADPSALDLFRNELNTARAVTHPNVCRLHDIHWTITGEMPPFFTMELLEGETLSHHILKAGRLELPAAHAIAGQIIDALAAAHSCGIIHRDLKPGNIMLVDGGERAVVMDFGLAREISPGENIESTLATGCVGTPAYMAPEQL